MNILNTRAGPAVVYVAAGGVAIYLAVRLLAKTFPDFRNWFNPTSDKNLAYTGVNAVGEALTGNKDFTLGGFIYDLFNEPYDPNLPATGKALKDLQDRLPVDPSKRPQFVK